MFNQHKKIFEGKLRSLAGSMWPAGHALSRSGLKSNLQTLSLQGLNPRLYRNSPFSPFAIIKCKAKIWQQQEKRIAPDLEENAEEKEKHIFSFLQLEELKINNNRIRMHLARKFFPSSVMLF